MEQRRFAEREGNVYRWLGSGIYFFEENFEAAFPWAKIRASQVDKEPAVLSVDIDLAKCRDLTQATFQSIVRNAHRDKQEEWRNNPASRPEQKPFELRGVDVRTGYYGDWEN